MNLDEKINLGDALIVRSMKDKIEHYGIYSGQNNVIHFYKNEDNQFKIQETDISDFVKDAISLQVKRMIYLNDQGISGEEIVTRAKNKIIKQNDNLIFNNCEHFVNYCINYKPMNRFPVTTSNNKTSDWAKSDKPKENQIKRDIIFTGTSLIIGALLGVGIKTLLDNNKKR